MADDPSDVSGIFTAVDEDANSASLAGRSNPSRRNPRDDDSVDIVAEYPALDDASVIISEDGYSGIESAAGGSGAESGVYTQSQKSETTTSKYAAPSISTGVVSANLFDGASYDVENSVSDGNTNEIMGNYSKIGTATPPPSEKKTGSWLTDTLQLFGLPVATMPTAGSSPDKSVEKESLPDEDIKGVTQDDVSSYNVPKTDVAPVTARSTPASDPEPSKLCGMSVARVIMLSACLVLVALIVVITAVVVSGDDDDNDTRAAPAPNNDPDFLGSLTSAPSLSPVTSAPTSAPSCTFAPDNDQVSFDIGPFTNVNCTWFREQEQLSVEAACETELWPHFYCRTTCKNCLPPLPMESPPSASPTTALPTTAAPTTATMLPTSPTNPPTSFPTSGPTQLPTLLPTSFPTPVPTPLPTIFPTARPTGFPTGGPTASPTTSFPTATPSALPTGTPSITATPTAFGFSLPPTVRPTPQPTFPLPTAAPVVPLNCDPDLPGIIPDFPGSVTCEWLAQTGEGFRESRCQEGLPAYEHCPTTCQACAP